MSSPTTPQTPSAPRRSLGRTALQWTLPLLLVAGAAAYASHWWTTGRFHEETDDAYVGADVTVIGAKIAGFIAELPVADNQFVHAGDLLARIDVRDYDALSQRAAGAVEAQQASLANLKANAALQQALIARARAGIDAAAAEEGRARDDFRRHEDLVSRASVSVESAQRAEATYKSAQAGYTELRAPRDGYVGNRKARVGSYVGAGTALLSIVPAQGLWIDANFKEDQLARMQPGQRVSVRADAWPGQVLHGRLGSLAPATGAQFSVLPAENATGNFTKIVQRVPVRIELDATDSALGRLRPGLSVVVDVDTAAPIAATTTKTASAL